MMKITESKRQAKLRQTLSAQFDSSLLSHSNNLLMAGSTEEKQSNDQMMLSGLALLKSSSTEDRVNSHTSYS